MEERKKGGRIIKKKIKDIITSTKELWSTEVSGHKAYIFYI